MTIWSKKTILFAAILYLVTMSLSTAHAEDLKPYFGFSFGNSYHDTGVTGLTGTASLDEDDTGWKILTGLKINDYVSFEAFYADLGEAVLRGNNGDQFQSDGVTYTFIADNVSISSEATSIGISGISYIPLDKLANNPSLKFITPFVKLGIHFWDIDATATGGGGGGGSISDDGADILGGIGINFNATDNFLIRTEYEYFGIDDDETGYLSLSAIYSF